MIKQWFILLLIIIIAVFFRFYNITETPPGLYPDEAMNGNDAVQVLESGDYKIFYPNNFGREGLFINLQAIAISIFGQEIWVLRAVSAVFGILTVIGLYFLTRFIFNWQIAALSSFFLAVAFWHVLFSRIGFRAIMAPFFLGWAMYFLWRGLVDYIFLRAVY